MAMTLRTKFTKVFPVSVIAPIDHDVHNGLNRRGAGRSVLVMHWQEAPGGRASCHWAIETPQADSTAL